MQAIATYDVAWSVNVLDMTVSFAKTDEPIKMPWRTHMEPRNRIRWRPGSHNRKEHYRGTCTRHRLDSGCIQSSCLLVVTVASSRCNTSLQCGLLLPILYHIVKICLSRGALFFVVCVCQRYHCWSFTHSYVYIGYIAYLSADEMWTLDMVKTLLWVGGSRDLESLLQGGAGESGTCIVYVNICIIHVFIVISR